MIQRLFVSPSTLIMRLFHFAAIALLSLGITACGGGSDLQSGTLDAPQLRLESFLVEGGELSPDFVSDRTGIYDIEVDDGVSSLNLTATLSSDTPADSRLLLITDPTLLTEGLGVPICFDGIEDDIDDIDEIIELTNGSSIDVPVEEGESTYFVRLANAEFDQCVDYIFRINRTGPTAALTQVFFSPAVAELVDEASGSLTAFDPEIFSYNVTVPYASCSFAIAPQAAQAGNTLTLDGIQINNLASRFIPLEPGIERSILIDVTSTDGSMSQTYTFNVTREEPVDTDLETDAFLQSVSLSNNGELLETFQCMDDIISAQVNSDVETVDLTIAASSPDATVVYSLLDEDGVLSEPIALPDNGIVPNIPVVPGNNFVTVVVSAGNETETLATRTNVIEILRTTTDWVFVDTAPELQQAMLNALPNQEIVIRRGTYSGVASIDESGSDGAHFFSSASGTQEQPITLRGLIAGAVTLSGSDLNTGSALEISGDHWQIVNLILDNAQTGLVLDGASDNIVDSLVISNVGERGIHLRNASSNNILSKIGVTNTGEALSEGASEVRAEALVVGSDDSDWLTATPAGELDPSDLNNRFFNMVFGPGIVSELVDIKEGTTGTELAYSNFLTFDVREAEAGSSVVIKGNDALLHHNSFSRLNSTVLDSMVATRDASESFHTVSWGENAEVFSNVFNLNTNQTTALVDAGESAAVFVADNLRDDAMTANYEGAGIDETFESPSYRIQSFEDDALCIVPGEIETADGVDELTGERMILGSCDDQMSEWVLRHELDRSLVVENSVSGDIISVSLTVINNVVTILPESFLLSFVETGEIVDSSNFFRWDTAFFADRIRIAPSSNSTLSLTATTLGELATAESFADEDANVVVLNDNDASNSQRFRFIEVE